MTRLLFLLGIVLCVLAFLGAGAEMAAQAIDPAIGWLPGTLSVWRTVSPDTFAAFIESLGSAPWWLAVLRLPPWLITGAPGLALIVAFRKHGPESWREQEEALYLYDELATRAHAEGYDTRDDMAPSEFDDVVPADAHYAEDFDTSMYDSDGDGASQDDAPSQGASGHDYLLKAKSGESA